MNINIKSIKKQVVGSIFTKKKDNNPIGYEKITNIGTSIWNFYSNGKVGKRL